MEGGAAWRLQQLQDAQTHSPLRSVDDLDDITYANCGCQATVFQCGVTVPHWRERFGAPMVVALKLMHHQNRDGRDIPDRLLYKEYTLAASPSRPVCPNILYLISGFVVPHAQASGLLEPGAEQLLRPATDTCGIVSEYHERCLDEYLEEDEEERGSRCRQCIVDVCQGVLDLYNHHIAHMDLKIDNLLVDRDGHAVVADLGMHEQWDDASGEKEYDYSSFPSGNLQNHAPDLHSAYLRLSTPFEERRARVQLDKQPTFALGVLIWEIITGSHPYILDYFEDVGCKSAIVDGEWGTVRDAMFIVEDTDTVKRVVGDDGYEELVRMIDPDPAVRHTVAVRAPRLVASVRARQQQQQQLYV